MPTETDARFTLAVPAELDEAAIGRFLTRLRDLLRGGPHVVYFDCSGLEHVTSSYVHVFWQAYERCQNAGASIRLDLAGPPSANGRWVWTRRGGVPGCTLTHVCTPSTSAGMFPQSSGRRSVQLIAGAAYSSSRSGWGLLWRGWCARGKCTARWSERGNRVDYDDVNRPRTD